MVMANPTSELASNIQNEWVVCRPLDSINLGKVRSGPVVNEVKLIRTSGRFDDNTWAGIFLGKNGDAEWQKWLEESGYGNESGVGYEVLSQNQRDRLNLLSTTHLPPIFLFHLALNTDIDLDLIVEKYSQNDSNGFGPTMFGVGSEESGQGKSVMSTILAFQLSKAGIASAGVLKDERSDLILDKLREDKLRIFDIEGIATAIHEGKVVDKSVRFESLAEVINSLWEVWSNMSGSEMLIVDLPAVKKNLGKNVRLLNGIDLLSMMMPSYKFAGERVASKNGFNWSHFNKWISGLHGSMAGTFGIDQSRSQGLRERFRTMEINLTQ